jgi:hypothetical protein
MAPRLGAQYNLEIEVMSKPKAEYHTEEYYELDLPTAPAIMVAEEIVTEGSDIGETDLEDHIRRHLGLEPVPKEKGWLKGLLKGKKE